MITKPHWFLSIGLAVCFFPAPFAEGQEQATAQRKWKYTIPDTDDSLPGNGPMRRADWFRNVWNNRRTTFSGNAAESTGAVVFLGDSITQGWGDGFRGDFESVKTANRGISGDTTRGMLWRLKEDVLDLKPAAVVMLMGTNDLEERAEPETIAGNIKEIIDQLKTHNADMPIVFCNVMPSSTSKKRPADKIQKLNELVFRSVKGDPQVTVVDTWTLFADENGDAKKSEFPDLLHPNKAGYAKWRAALLPIFSTLGFIETTPEPYEFEENSERLFNGKDLTGWMFLKTTEAERTRIERARERNPNGIAKPIFDSDVSFDGKKASSDGRYVAIHDRLVVTTPPEGRRIEQLWTKKEFNEDFELRLEFRATPNADSGVFVRGKQLQCRDFLLAGPYKNLNKYQPQDWNTMVIRVQGTTAHCTCNGEVLEEKMEVPASGRIGLEGDRGQIEYRRLRVLPLKSDG